MKNMINNENLIELEIFDILLTEHGFQVVLTSSEYINKALNIIVAFTDAHPLTMQYHKVRTNKPLFIDTVQNIFKLLDVVPKFTLIYDIEDHQFSTRIYFENKMKHRFVVESKISDVLSIVMSNPSTLIFISKEVFEKTAVYYNFYEEKGEDESQQYKNTKIKELKELLKTAVQEERYEEAALIRDQLKKMQGE